ncbi:ribosomal L32p protein family-domain-containing protein [Naematelia encephala]|uniref:Large ribosomal subunit protein bL32m n=1 Tax=Naematelia encephala TaxID=71784 RepID=A0A1Y2B3Y7_9TREE|nr:ribosomal L32p protein family-domain-containing protein [Naematelia encephala]
MASLQLSSLAPSRTVLPFLSFAPRLLALRPTWSVPCEASTSSPSPSSSLSMDQTPSTSTPWYSSILPSISSLLELFPPILLAVPKKKVSHSRKRMRSAIKGLKNKTNFSICPACGEPKLSHNICPSCYSQISRRWKAEARGEDITIHADSSKKGAEVKAD